MSDDLLERLVDWDEYDEGKLNDMREEAKARIEQLTAERDGLLRCVTDNHVALCRAEKAEADFARQVQRTDEQREAYEQALSVMEAERDRLREALRDGRRLLAIAQDDRIRLLIQLEQCEASHE